MRFMLDAMQSGDVFSKDISRNAKSTALVRERLAEKEKPKTPTAEVSFEMFRSGKSIGAIAKERGLVQGTIESHLTKYVANGSIPITELVEEQKVKKIMEVLKSDAVGLGEVKSKLPKNYSFGEIRLVVAHHGKS
ncbi:MAG: helix-turn-helix domain-containing protein [Bacteroidota bacterium]